MQDRTRGRPAATADGTPVGALAEAREDVTRIVPAWVCDRRTVERVANRARSEGPHLRLQVVQDEGDALAVQVAEGNAPSRDALLYVEDRGVFGVSTLLRRQSGGGARLYVRLRAWRPATTCARTVRRRSARAPR